MKYQVEVLSPVHIDSGNRISPLEYLLENRFNRIDMDGLFNDPLFNVDEFMKSVDDRLYMGGFSPALARKHIRYSLDLGREMQKNKKAGEVFEFIKSRGKAFIPGSSLKGALRTAVLYHAVKNDETFYRKLLHTVESAPDNPKTADDAFDCWFFGDIKNDFMKGLIVSDSNLVSTDALRLQMIGVLSLTHQNALYKKLEMAVECLKIQSKLEVTIHVDDFFFSEAAQELGFESKKKYLDDLPGICKEYSDDLIDYEYSFFKRCRGFDDVCAFYERLADIEDGFLLRMSWGSGWQGMSIARLFADEDPFFMNMRRKYRLGKTQMNVFPKSRKLVFDDKRYPLGWLKLVKIL